MLQNCWFPKKFRHPGRLSLISSHSPILMPPFLTYGNCLPRRFAAAKIAALSIATRPDCLEPEKIQLLKELNQIKPVWAELGLQTIHPETADFIRRGYPLSCFEASARQLKAAGLTVIVHLILGLPGESPRQMLESVDYLAHFSPSIDGIKLQLLHVLKGTDLAKLYLQNPFPLFSLEEYVDFVITCLERLPPSMVIHRLTGDGPKSLLLAPAWSADKNGFSTPSPAAFVNGKAGREKNLPRNPNKTNPPDKTYCSSRHSPNARINTVSGSLLTGIKTNT